METKYLDFMHQPNPTDEAVNITSGYCNVGKNDIFINPDFQEIMRSKDTLRMMEIPYTMMPMENHRCHIFINNHSEDIINSALREYIKWAYEVTGRKVIVHIPKSRPYCKVLFCHLMTCDMDSCQLVFSKNTYQMFFYVETDLHVEYRTRVVSGQTFHPADCRLVDRYVAIAWADLFNTVMLSIAEDINRRGDDAE